MDLISREMAIGVVGGRCGMCIQDILDIPSAEPERRPGRWMQISPAGIYECSQCAQMVMTEDVGCYKYCHGCGAYMGGDTDGDMPD